MAGESAAPLLFVIAMDTLAAMVNCAAAHNVLAPIGKKVLPSRASLYADNIVFFLNPEITEYKAIMELLQLFRAATGLFANRGKNAAIPISVLATMIHDIVDGFGCPVAAFPITYLGICPYWTTVFTGRTSSRQSKISPSTLLQTYCSAGQGRAGAHHAICHCHLSAHGNRPSSVVLEEG